MAIARGGFEHKGGTGNDSYRGYRARLVGHADCDLSGREPALQGCGRMRHTVRLNFEAWADALEGRAPYRFTSEQLLANISILDAVTRSAAADGKPIAV